MMKQVALRLEEEMIKKVKLKALNENTTFQAVASKALEQHLVPTVDKEKIHTELTIGNHTMRLTSSEYAKLANHFYKEFDKRGFIKRKTGE